MLDKINKLTNWQVALIIVALGLVVFFSGLNNPFQGDDIGQILNNTPVHSVQNIRLFFEGSTFYDGGSGNLIGVYYRPLMTTVFSVLYTLFGPHPVYFHLFQMLLGIGSAVFLYLFFRYSFKPALALCLSLIFLLHPLSSQVLFAIPAMQDALFFFFGILAMWLLVRFHSAKSLILVATCLFLSLLSKESGMLFVIMTLLYLCWWERKRLLPFIGIITGPIIVWFVLRVSAVGLFAHITSNPNAPIQKLGLLDRLMNLPSIELFYINKFFFPYRLASGYYWVHSSYSFRYFLLPLLIDLVVVALVIYVGLLIRRKAAKSQFFTYVFFAAWMSIGLLLSAQILPSDMTVSESWFYFPMVGVLGMIGTAWAAFPPRIRLNRSVMLAVMIVIIGLLGVRTGTRGLEWRSEYILAKHDIAVSPENFSAYISLANSLTNQGKYEQAKAAAEKSIDLYPTFSNYYDLGVVSVNLGDYSGAYNAYSNSLKYQTGNRLQTYERAALLALVTQANQEDTKQLLTRATEEYPQASNLWLYRAI